MDLLQLRQIICSSNASVTDKEHISRHHFPTFSLLKIKGRIIATHTTLIFQSLHSCSNPLPLPAQAALLCLPQPLSPQDYHPSHPTARQQGTGPPYHQHQLHPHAELLTYKPEQTSQQRRSRTSQWGANCCFIRHSWEVAEPTQLRLGPAALALGPLRAGLVLTTAAAFVYLQYWCLFFPANLLSSMCRWHNFTVFWENWEGGGWAAG